MPPRARNPQIDPCFCMSGEVHALTLHTAVANRMIAIQVIRYRLARCFVSQMDGLIIRYDACRLHLASKPYDSLKSALPTAGQPHHYQLRRRGNDDLPAVLVAAPLSLTVTVAAFRSKSCRHDVTSALHPADFLRVGGLGLRMNYSAAHLERSCFCLPRLK